METPPRKLTVFSRGNATRAILATGVVLALFTFREARVEERQRAEALFVSHAAIRHTLTREFLRDYEDALFGLATMFMLDARVTHAEFVHAASRIEERNHGVQAFEWVPVVSRETRAAMEAAGKKNYPQLKFEITERDANWQLMRANDRPEYYPIVYVHPLAGNEPALGLDLKNGPTRPDLERAKESHRALVTAQLRLVQGQKERAGVIMIWPVWRTREAEGSSAGERELFVGFVQGVFYVRDMIEAVCSLRPNTILDMMFIDASEQDPAKRLLYYRPRDGGASGVPAPTEAEFRGGVFREHSISIGGREWVLLCRPYDGWIPEQFTSTPPLRASLVLLVTGLIAAMIYRFGRRAEIVERQVAERTAELSESRRQLSSLMHALPGMAYRCQPGEPLNVLYASEGALALTGHAAEDFTSQRVHFRDFIHPEDIERVRAATRAGLNDRREFEIEYRVRARDGTEKWLLSRSRGVYAPDGTLQVFEGLAIDITAQKRAETDRIAIERKLLEGQKLESLGLLAGGIAHDFNNLLTGILGNAGLARLTLPRGSPSEQQLRAIETASLRAAELCRQMLAYAGKGRFVVEPTDLSSLVEGMLPLLKISIGAGVNVQLSLGADLPAVMADATQLRQIVMNLVINASDALGDRKGSIFLTTGLMTADRALLRAAVAGADLAEGKYVFLEVRDTGCGMSPETIAKIFDPFFSTKFAGRGLGLAAVLGIVRGHHGALRVQSTSGQGSTFRLLLPPIAQEAAAPVTPATAVPWHHSAQILIIEDDEVVRTVAAEALKTYGLTPHTAPDGDTGLALFEQRPKDYALVLLDLIMPGRSGEQTLAGLRAIRPDVSVLMMSGYNETDTLTRLADPKSKLAFLHKPFTRAMLEEKLRAMLPP